MHLKPRQKIIATIALLGVLSFFLPIHFIHAFGIMDLSPTSLFTAMLQSVFTGIEGLTAIIAKALSVAIVVRAGGTIPVVTATWKILRDFSNMFFIIMLIYMAFATVFDQTNYKFQNMIARFILVAVLINFSLVIGNLVIDACQVLSNVFLGSIGDLGGRLGLLLNPSILLNAVGSTGPVDLSAASITTLIFAIILSLIFVFSITVAMAFAVIRIPIIWGLLIISPLAWMSHILPSSNKWWSKWWSLFRGWNLFLPVYLFFMYIGLTFLAQRDAVIAEILRTSAGSGASLANAGLIDGVSKSLTFNLLFFYIFAAVVMVGGLWAAIQTTSMMGSGFDWGVEKAKGFAKWIPLPGGSLSSQEYAIGKRFEQFQKEGIGKPGFFGSDRRERHQNQAAALYGVRDAQFKNAKEQVSSVEKEVARLKDMERAGKLEVNEAFKTATAKESNMSARGIAMRSLLYERGMMDEPEFEKDLKTWTTANPFLAESMIKKAQKGGFKKISADKLLQMAAAQGPYAYLGQASGSATRKDFFNTLIGDKDIKGVDQALSRMTTDQLKQAVGLMGGHDSNESTKFRRELGKKRPDLIGAYNWERSQNEVPPQPITLEESIYDVIKDNKSNDLGEVLQSVWTGSPEFKNALRLRIQVQNSAVPPVESGILVPTGVPVISLPPDLFAPGVDQTVTPNGTIYHLPKWPAGVPKPRGVKAYKGRPGGGEAFKSSLEKATSTNVVKNQIASTL